MKGLMKYLKSETFLFLVVIGGLCLFLWMKMNKHYNHVLDGTKYQIQKKDPRK